MTVSASVRPASLQDLDALVAVHLVAFPDSSLTALGHQVVGRYYRWQLSGPHEVTALVAGSGAQVSGFLVGGVFRGSLVGFLRRNRWFVAQQALRRPRVLASRRGLANIRLALDLLSGRARVAPGDAGALPERSFGVLAVAVDPEFRGQGVASALLGAAAAAARAGGFERMHLTVDPTNYAALDLYRAAGWHQWRPGGHHPNLCVRELGEPEAG